MPRRVQRTRVKGQPGIPAGARYVGRPGPYGNPFRVVRCGPTLAVLNADGGIVHGHPADEADARRIATDWYRSWLPSQTELLARARRELIGRDLACWCALPAAGEPDHCHARVLIELANAATEVQR